ncbi:DapH/DapD/GlmU-related protein [Polynucleobacter sp. es-MAR-4]|uniref:acyltransferase n=1 Tax=Polynucleobacter sp. es-MAR-4 TaxID=1855655 RepID=UPI001C0B4648|nr:DapH/DapD/GlmU-related protein [Polynucleobacter sp. es-MAR-4]MBU3637571.1 acetyltransferase [Polynucleobacter sp. es-MAR-4]
MIINFDNKNSLSNKIITKFDKFWTLIFLRFQFYKIGKKVIVRSPRYIYNSASIQLGDNVTIGPGCRIEAYNSYSLKNPSLIISEGASIQHGVHIYSAGKLTIDRDCLVGSGCMITDNNHGMSPISGPYRTQPLEVKETHIGENVWLGENVAVLAGSEIGSNSIIGANSVVTGFIPENSVAVGIPARVIKKYDFDLNKWIKC